MFRQVYPLLAKLLQSCSLPPQHAQLSTLLGFKAKALLPHVWWLQLLQNMLVWTKQPHCFIKLRVCSLPDTVRPSKRAVLCTVLNCPVQCCAVLCCAALSCRAVLCLTLLMMSTQGTSTKVTTVSRQLAANINTNTITA